MIRGFMPLGVAQTVNLSLMTVNVSVIRGFMPLGVAQKIIDNGAEILFYEVIRGFMPLGVF